MGAVAHIRVYRYLVIGNNTWKFQEFLTYGIGCSMTFTEFGGKNNGIETIGVQEALLLGPLIKEFPKYTLSNTHLTFKQLISKCLNLI